jgi:hypothetical protein
MIKYGKYYSQQGETTMLQCISALVVGIFLGWHIPAPAILKKLCPKAKA